MEACTTDMMHQVYVQIQLSVIVGRSYIQVYPLPIPAYMHCMSKQCLRYSTSLGQKVTLLQHRMMPFSLHLQYSGNFCHVSEFAVILNLLHGIHPVCMLNTYCTITWQCTCIVALVANTCLVEVEIIILQTFHTQEPWHCKGARKQG